MRSRNGCSARYRPWSDKVMRMHAQTAMIENGFVHPPEAAPWLAPYLAELFSFGSLSESPKAVQSVG